MTYILNVKIDINNSLGNIMGVIDKLLMDGKQHIICTTNPEFIVYAQNDNEFMHIINSSDISVPDGYGVILAYNYINRINNIHNNLNEKRFKSVKFFLTGIGVFIDSILSRNIEGECMAKKKTAPVELPKVKLPMEAMARFVQKYFGMGLALTAAFLALFCCLTGLITAISTPAKIPMITITIKSSIRVKPEFR